MLQIFHETAYRYAQQVARSSHRLRLRPLVDAQQSLVDWKLDLSVDGERWEYEDVFGNHVTSLEVSTPFQELVIRSSSLVRVHVAAPEPLRTAPGRDRLPLAWMPWQRQLMLPYLLPPELPESELMALRDFALGFVERNGSDLLATLQDMNATLYRDFAYVPGITNAETTPFEVFVARQGVCQDFAHLLICLARLLDVPARYRVGYIHTGSDYENRLQSEASHAWVEIYLPGAGWRGLDPTNGCLVGADHVRVACGRHFWDAAPTSGTIYGGGGETLSVEVRVERVTDSSV